MGPHKYESSSEGGGAPETTKTATKLFQPYLKTKHLLSNLVFDGGVQSQKSQAPAPEAGISMEEEYDYQNKSLEGTAIRTDNLDAVDEFATTSMHQEKITPTGSIHQANGGSSPSVATMSDDVDVDVDPATFAPESLPQNHWWHVRCAECANCEKRACGQCKVCRCYRNPKGEGTMTRTMTNDCPYCYQKMCLNVGNSVKAQPAPTFPDGWLFVFTSPVKNDSDGQAVFADNHNVLSIMSSNKNRRYRAVRAAVNQNPVALQGVDPTSFYSQVGLDPPSDAGESMSMRQQKLATSIPTFVADAGVRASGRKRPVLSSKVGIGCSPNGGEMEQKDGPEKEPHIKKNTDRCGKCDGCKKLDCGKCKKCILKIDFGGKGSRGACVNKPCIRFVYHGRPTYQTTAMLNEEDALSKEESDSDSEHSNGSFVQGALSSKLGVGSRSYSRYSNLLWYWGVITAVSGKGKCARYSVDFDDGDFLGDIPWTDICSETQYKEDIHEDPHFNAVASPPKKRQKKRVEQTTVARITSPEKSGLSLFDFRRQRCKNCVMCIKADCGMCRACQDNKEDTSIHKQVCLLKMCENFSPEEKAQPIPGREHLKFYFTDPRKLPAHWRERALHPALEGFCVVSPRNQKQFRGIETAIKASKMRPEQRIEIAKTFYEDHIGIRVRLNRVHLLVGKGYFREWNDTLGRPREIYGRIEQCEQDYFDRASSYFTVKYDYSSRNQLLTNGSSIPSNDGSVSEKDAWGGCLLYDLKSSEINQTPRSLNNASAPFHTRWIIPSSRTKDHVVSENPAAPVRSFSMNVRGCILEIVAKKSLIPNSGLGVFVKAFKGALMSKPVKYFELQAGEMVDLCVYAPLRPQDRMDESVNLFKNFIHSWEPEGWTFDQAAHHKGKASNVFDITDDWSADLHSLARQNVMVYVNETDGEPKSIPTVCAEHDPAGAVHYLLGHQEKEHGKFRLPLNGKEIELKIDYGDAYEKVRVRKGYSRGTKAEAAIIKRKIEDGDSNVVKDLRMFTAKEVNDCVAFLERIFTPERVITDSDTDKVARSIVAAVLLLTRVKAIVKEFEGVDLLVDEFCDNGYTSLEGNQTLERARKLVSRLCDLWENENLMAVLVSKELYCIVLVPALNCASPQELTSLSPLEFRTRINSICSDYHS